MSSGQYDNKVLIAVMGATGTGKTTFINKASNSNLRVGSSLYSCTGDVQISAPFKLDGRDVLIVDSPGFDDTNLSDTEVLKKISAFLEATYIKGVKLAGVIYMHRITDIRMGGMSTRNFRMFRKLCGVETLKNVVIVTNMWGEVSLEVGESREAELSGNFFKSALDSGAKLVRHHHTAASAHEILRKIIGNHPRPLRFQTEVVDEGKGIPETAAGEELNREFAEQIKKQFKELEALRKEKEEVEKDRDLKDEQRRKELNELNKARISAEKMLKDAEDARKRLAEDNKNMRDEITRKMEEMENSDEGCCTVM